MRFLTYSVPDTNVQREMIAEAIARTYLEEIDQHAEAIAAYTVETKPGIVSNRAESIQRTLDHMVKLERLMNGRYPRFVERCIELQGKVTNLQTEQTTAQELEAQQRRVGGQRRIVVAR